MILTGDLHANTTNELDYLNPDYLRSKFGSKCENTYIIILGDGGFLWYKDRYSGKDGKLIKTLEKWLCELGSCILVVPGNHENYNRIYGGNKLIINKYHHRETQYAKYSFRYSNDFKGATYEVSDHIWYTSRYGEYEIEGKTILVLGGARSLDQGFRIPNKEWFIEETFSIEEKDEIFEKYTKDYDYVFAHTCPDSVLKEIYGSINYRDNNSEFFSKLMNWISVKDWYFGHLHPERINNKWNNGDFDKLNSLINGTKYHCLYKELQDVI